jgi:hypothetical protein
MDLQTEIVRFGFDNFSASALQLGVIATRHRSGHAACLPANVAHVN